jgi:hypothetical protein
MIFMAGSIKNAIKGGYRPTDFRGGEINEIWIEREWLQIRLWWKGKAPVPTNEFNQSTFSAS